MMPGIPEVLENSWQIPVSHIQPDLLTGGSTNDNWLIQTDDGSKLVLREVRNWRVHWSDNFELDLKFQHLILNMLHQSEKYPYTIPLPIPTIDENTYVLEDSTYYWLYDFIEGKQLKPLNTNQIDQLIELTANLYLHIHKFDDIQSPQPAVQLPIKFLYHRIDEVLGRVKTRTLEGGENSNPAYDMYIRDYPELKSIIDNLAKININFPTLPTHGDLQPGNLIWDSDNHLVALIDFEYMVSNQRPIIAELVHLMLVHAPIKELETEYFTNQVQDTAQKFLISWKERTNQWNWKLEIEAEIRPQLSYISHFLLAQLLEKFFTKISNRDILTEQEYLKHYNSIKQVAALIF